MTLAALLAALLVVTGALVAVMAVVAWLDTPRAMEADGSRGLRGPDQDQEEEPCVAPTGT